MKKSVSQRLWTRIQCEPEFFSGFNCLKVVCITAMINHVFISVSAIQKYDLSYVFIYYIKASGILSGKNLIQTITQIDKKDMISSHVKTSVLKKISFIPLTTQIWCIIETSSDLLQSSSENAQKSSRNVCKR